MQRLNPSPLLIAALALWFTAACGRPATEAECDEIVVRITELELKSHGGESATKEEVKATREALKKTTLSECVGRRISDEAMACVRNATSAQQIIDTCF